jgi:hypothetical protein
VDKVSNTKGVTQEKGMTLVNQEKLYLVHTVEIEDDGRRSCFREIRVNGLAGQTGHEITSTETSDQQFISNNSLRSNSPRIVDVDSVFDPT